MHSVAKAQCLIRVFTAGELWDLLEDGESLAGGNDRPGALNGSGSFGGHLDEHPSDNFAYTGTKHPSGAKHPSDHLGYSGALNVVASLDDKSRPSSSPAVINNGPVFDVTINTDDEVQ
ncbi:hypothetical protein MRX96_015492 [Rhipicephalus microplus]